MKFIVVSILFGMLGWGMCKAQQSVKTEDRVVRIMSYNIHNGVGLDGKRDYDRLAEIIRREDPAVVALQEVDSVTERSGKVDVLKELAVRTGMYPVYGAAIEYQGGKYGIGVLSKEKPLKWSAQPLPGREEERVFLMVEFEKYVLCATHFSLTEADQLVSVPLICRKIQETQKPVFLAGDLNAHPGSPTINLLKEHFRSLTGFKYLTFPADRPEECLDYIWLYKQENVVPVAVVGREVIKEKVASDHRPVIVAVRIGAESKDIFRIRPYLQNPTGQGITVSWLTHVPVYSWVEYGTDPERLEKAHTVVDGQVIANNYIHKIRLQHLQTGVKYYYRVCSREILSYGAYHKEFGNTACSDLLSFELPGEKETGFTALIFNDVHKQDRTLETLYKQVKDVEYDFVFFNGDCIDDPADEEEAVKYLSFFNEQVGADRIPVFYLRGNHEIRNAYSIGLRNLFDYVGGKTYGAFNWGDTRFVMLDCGEDKPDSTWVYYGLNDFTQLRQDQVGFLQQELSSPAFKKAAKRVLIHHIPVFGNTDKYQPCRELWGKLLADAPFQVAVNAHTHRYAYHPADAQHAFPILIGGGYKLPDATVMVLRKDGKKMTLTVLNGEGTVLQELSL